MSGLGWIIRAYKDGKFVDYFSSRSKDECYKWYFKLEAEGKADYYDFEHDWDDGDFSDREEEDDV